MLTKMTKIMAMTIMMIKVRLQKKKCENLVIVLHSNVSLSCRCFFECRWNK